MPHTAISRRADEYRKVTVLTDATTTATEMLHLIAVAGLAPRVNLATVAALPFAIGIVTGAGISSKLVEKLPARSVAVPRLHLGALGMLWLSRLTPDTSYFVHVMPGAFAVSSGLGASAIAMTLTAVQGV